MPVPALIELILLSAVPILAGGCGWMLRWKYRVDTADAETRARLSAAEAGAAKAEAAEAHVQEVRLMIATDYVQRADYILQMSTLDQKISAIGAGVMRLESRAQAWPGSGR